MLTPAQRALGVHRVLDPAGVLPQAARRLDADPAIGPDEVRIAVQRLNLDAASFRQLSEAHGGDGEDVRAAVLDIVATRGKMQNPVTGSGGMLIGVVDAVGPESPLGLAVGDRVATLVSLTLTPLRITDGLTRWDGRSEQVPAEGTAILFARSIAAVLPDDLPDAVSLAVLDVCGAPAATARVVERAGARSVTVLGAAGKSGSLSLAAARRAGATTLTGLVRNDAEAAALRASGLADRVVVADATDPLAVVAAVGAPADVTVVCVDVQGAEHGADPGHGRRWHRGLLLHGDVVLGGGPGSGGDGGGRDHAGRQRIHAGARGPGPRPVPPEAGVRALIDPRVEP